MKIFSRNLTCKWRLIGFICFLLILVNSAGLGGISSMYRFHAKLSDVYFNNVIPVADLRQINHIFQTDIVQTADKLLFEQISRDEALKTTKTAWVRFDEKWASLIKTADAESGAKGNNWLETNKYIIAEADPLPWLQN